MTKKDFILPLFRALGWNIEDSTEVTAEEKISKKRVDYGFRINGIPKFFLEAKSLKVDLDKPKFFEQAVNYAWHKGCTWAVLTDFEAVKILNAEWRAANYLQSHFTTIRSYEFLKRFDELWLLSKDSFEQGLLNKEAEKWGKKTKKTSIDKQLLADFTRFREMLSRNITKLNQSKHLTEEELDESVQRVLDRLIFIRNCEDRELEAKTLISSMREWESRGKGQLIKSLREVFASFDKKYNSKIFAKHLCDDLEVDNEVLQQLIRGLYYTKDRFFTISYDFSAIDADVLGNIYEQYLSHILRKTEKRAKLTESRVHRKKQGIYYTPTYIVDYIVRNTLGELLKDEQVNVEKIRVLDPACGSGSFLIKAFDVLNEYYLKNDKDYAQSQLDLKTGAIFTKKVKILQNNIFGVDLDKQAVEIAQLNLLLKIAEKGHRLPLLEQNIKCGNSLIDDEKITGNKAFKWEKEFQEIMKEGGFDVVIGNPPYGAKLSDKEKGFKKLRYKDDKTGNTASLFILKGLELVKEGGYLAYIVPKQLTYISSWESIRKILLKLDVVCIIDVSEAFEDVELEQVIFIIKKEKRTSKKLVVGFSNRNKIEKTYSNIRYFSNERFPLWINENNYSIFDKVLKDSVPLGKLARVNWGGPVAKYLSKTRSTDSIICLRGREIRRYNMLPEHFIEEKNIVPSYVVKGEKLFVQRIVSRRGKKIIANYRDARFVATYCSQDYYADKTVTMVWDSEINVKYLLGIINSKLISWFAHRYLYNRSQLTMEFMYSYARNFPVRNSFTKDQEIKIINLVDKMLSLNKRLNEIGDKLTDERAKIEEEIRKTDAEIDELVYKIYGISEAEKKIIENSLK
ncbi:N-6 DNA methylase [Candidatus Bathyarchaeota archaeon]|nr:N-6 DNA methylase [Candidatus Bathyarchaeota archaeon]